MGPEIGVPKAAKLCLSAPIGRLLSPNEHAQEALGYFPNSFGRCVLRSSPCAPYGGIILRCTQLTSPRSE
jgi:hypothetical protein